MPTIGGPRTGGPRMRQEPPVSSKLVLTWAGIALGALALNYHVEGFTKQIVSTVLGRELVSRQARSRAELSQPEPSPLREAKRFVAVPSEGASDTRRSEAGESSESASSAFPYSSSALPEQESVAANAGQSERKEDEPVRTGRYRALRSTPVRSAPHFTAEIEAWLGQGQNVQVVGGAGEFFEVRSVNDRPPGFVARADVEFYSAF